jgi:cellulose synthase/poly-beta-1,6-N-acetylglucosamine synthase-like glycosyltransferase
MADKIDTDLTKKGDLKISVIVPVYNEERYIGNTLDALLSQRYENYEIIAVNDASKDNTARVLEKYKSIPRVRIINKEKNEGQAKAINTGLDFASGEIIARIDGDSIAPPDWLEKINANFKKDNILAVGGWLDVSNDCSYWALANSLKDAIFNGFLKKRVTPNILPGANTAILASVFRQMGGYPEKDSYYSEDFQLYLKLSKLGKVVKDDSLRIKTYYPEKLRGSLKRKFYWGVAGADVYRAGRTPKFYLRPLYYSMMVALIIAMFVSYIVLPSALWVFSLLLALQVLPMTLGLFLLAIAYIIKERGRRYVKVLPTALFYPFLLEFVYFIGLVSGLRGRKVKVWRSG